MKNVMIRFLTILLAFQGFVAAQLLVIEPAHASAAPDVVINEVMWMGSTAASGSEDEWVELFNTATEGFVDLSSWTLTNVRTVGAGNDFVIPANTELNAGEYLLIGQAGLLSTVRAVPLDLEVTSFSLSNPSSCRIIELKNQLDELIDGMDCNGDGSYFGGENTATKRSLERNFIVADGTQPGNWHTSIGFKNLVAGAAPNNFATPKFVNDETPANTTAAIVNDGSADDVDWNDNPAVASANWDGFADDESGVVDYMVGLGLSAGSDDVVAFTDVDLATSHVFVLGANLTEGVTYFATVQAVNGVGLVSELSSDGFTVDTANPEPASNPTVTDVASDNGGSVLVQWDASTSLDEITYRVDYHKVGDATVLSQSAGSLLEATINGLENGPVVYEFAIVAIDFSSRESLVNPTVQGSALDNLAPILDATKLTVAQNNPGSNDTVSGAAGASSELATVTVFDRAPTDPMAVVLASVQTNVGFGFDAVSIGDNRYPTVWLQLVDAGGNASNIVSVANDIVGPATPTITKGKVTCKTMSCRVELSWTAPADSTAYIVEYGSGVNVIRTAPISNTTLILDLPADGSYNSFVVYALDQFGNISGKSNSFFASLVAGVVTSGELVDGDLAVTTAALEGSKETIQSPAPTTPAKLVPTAQAADDMVVNVAGQQDWLRIAIVVVLLLIVAGGFYSLSRSMQSGPLDIPALPVAAGKAAKRKGKKRGKSRR